MNLNPKFIFKIYIIYTSKFSDRDLGSIKKLSAYYNRNTPQSI